MKGNGGRLTLYISSFSLYFLPLSPFPNSLSISSSFPHSLAISSQPGCKAATIRAALVGASKGFTMLGVLLVFLGITPYILGKHNAK